MRYHECQACHAEESIPVHRGEETKEACPTCGALHEIGAAVFEEHYEMVVDLIARPCSACGRLHDPDEMHNDGENPEWTCEACHLEQFTVDAHDHGVALASMSPGERAAFERAMARRYAYKEVTQ